MNIDSGTCAAIGACTTAVLTLGLLIIGVLTWRIQSRRFRGKLQFELVPNGEYLSAVLSNTGECVAREISISSKPPLTINFNNKFHYDGCVGTYASWLIGSTIHELLPHRSIPDDNPFPIKDFNIHFADYATIVIQLKYTLDNKVVRDYQTIDISLLRTRQEERSNREIVYRGLKEKAK